jgi:hypothetical protein
MRLEKNAFGCFHAALCDAFDRQSLKMMLRLKLDRDYEDFETVGAGFEAVVFDLISRAEREGWTEDLLHCACAERAQNEKIQAFLKQYPTYAVVQTVPETSSLPAGNGLVALINRMHVPTVALAVHAYRHDFESACVQIEVLGDYKDLHDLLHRLQFDCYDLIARECRYFPEDERACSNLEMYELTLQNLLVELQDVAGRGRFDSTEVAWIKDDLEAARTQLRTALQNADTKALRFAVLSLNRVLACRPSQINTRLNATARVLRLPELIKAMTMVRDTVQGLSLDPQEAATFSEEVIALTALNRKLDALIREHDRWQEVDVLLRRIETSLEQSLEELELCWPRLKERTEPLYSPYQNDWARAFKEEAAQMESALAIRDLGQVQKRFRRYQRQASHRFYRVDASLKELCDHLRQVSQPLTHVLDVMGG